MNAPAFNRALRAPWMASRPAVRWFTGVLVAASALVSAGMTLFLPFDNHGLSPVYALMPAVGLAWVMFLPNMIVLSRQARDLCLPGLQRDVALSLLIYALLTILAPALLLRLAGTPLLPSALLLSLASLIGLVYATAPWILSMLICFMPALAPRLGDFWDPAPPGSAGFATWAVPFAVVLFAIAVYQWRRFTHGSVSMTGFMRPVIVGLNANLRDSLTGTSSSGRTAYDPIRMMRQRPGWLQPVADLRRAGPGHPVFSLRVALGGFWVPQRIRDALRRFLLNLVFLLPVAALLALVLLFPDHPEHRAPLFGGVWVVNAMSVAMIEFTLAMVALIVALSAGKALRHQWQLPNRELPLLALLPGLGQDRRAQRHLLRAVVDKPALYLLCLWCLMLGVGLYARLPLSAMAFLAVVVPGCLLMALADFMLTLGRARPTWVRVMDWLLHPLTIVLAMVGTLLPCLILGSGASLHAQRLTTWMLASSWLLHLALTVSALGTGWRAFRRRPLAFVPCP